MQANTVSSSTRQAALSFSSNKSISSRYLNSCTPNKKSFSLGSRFLKTDSCKPSYGRTSLCEAVKQTFTSFEDMLENSSEPVLVDFYAVWCGPCQLMSKELATLSQSKKGQLKIVKIDSEKYPKLASDYGVQALPTLVLFKNGKAIHRWEGALSARDLEMAIDGVLSAYS